MEPRALFSFCLLAAALAAHAQIKSPNACQVRADYTHGTLAYVVHYLEPGDTALKGGDTVTMVFMQGETPRQPSVVLIADTDTVAALPEGLFMANAERAARLGGDYERFVAHVMGELHFPGYARAWQPKPANGQLWCEFEGDSVCVVRHTRFTDNPFIEQVDSFYFSPLHKGIRRAAIAVTDNDTALEKPRILYYRTWHLISLVTGVPKQHIEEQLDQIGQSLRQRAEAARPLPPHQMKPDLQVPHVPRKGNAPSPPMPRQPPGGRR